MKQKKYDTEVPVSHKNIKNIFVTYRAYKCVQIKATSKIKKKKHFKMFYEGDKPKYKI